MNQPTVDPYMLIPAKKRTIGRLKITLHAPDGDFEKVKADLLARLSWSIEPAHAANEPRLLHARFMGESTNRCIEMDFALFYPPKTSEYSFAVEDKNCEFAPIKGWFPMVLFYDFYTATEHAMNDLYPVWLSQHQANVHDLEQQRQTCFENGPVFSIVVPLFETPLDFLRDAVDSILAQTYRNWELVLVNASPANAQLAEAVRECTIEDSRIISLNMENEGIVGNTNAGIRLATGDFVGFMDHDDKVEPDLLYTYASALDKDPDIDFFYCDEDLFDEDRYFDPLFKPNFNLDLLRVHNYITHFHCVRACILNNMELPTSDLEGAQDYDITFKACEKARKIKHVPRVLYHWRAHSKSSNIAPGSKPYAEEAGRLAIQRHLGRTNCGCTVTTGNLTNTYRVAYPLRGNPLVSVIIPSHDQASILSRCLASLLAKGGWDNLEIIIVENNSSEPETFEEYARLEDLDSRIKIIEWKAGTEFNYSSLINTGVEASAGEYLLLLNNDTEIKSDGFVRELLSHAQRKEVGIVGARLLFPDDTIQHAGVVVDFSDKDAEPAMHLFRNLPSENGGYHDRAVKTQDYSVVTGACQMMRKSTFKELGEYDEHYAVAFNDVDFCLKARQASYLVVYDSDAIAYHYESVSRGNDSENSEKAKRAESEREQLFEKWSDEYSEGDQYFNPNFDRSNPYCNFACKRNSTTMAHAAKRLAHRAMVSVLHRKPWDE